MTYENKAKSIAKHAIAFGVILSLALSVVFIGGVSAADPVNNSSVLAEKVSQFSAGSTDVDIYLTNNINLAKSDLTSIVGNLIKTMVVNPKDSKKLTIELKGYEINAETGSGSTEKVVTLTSSNDAKLVFSITDESGKKKSSMQTSSGTVSLLLKYGTNTVEFNKFNSADVSLLLTPDSNSNANVKLELQTGNGVIKLGESGEFKIESISIPSQYIYLMPDMSSKSIEINSIEGKTVSGKIKFTGTNNVLSLSSDDFEFYGQYNNDINAQGNINSADVTYHVNDANSDSTATLFDVNGTMNSGLDLEGTVSLTSDWYLPVRIPVPSFVSGIVSFDGQTITNPNGAILTDGSSKTITLMGPVQFMNPVTDHKNFIIPRIGDKETYVWTNENKQLVAQAVPIDNPETIDADIPSDSENPGYSTTLSGITGLQGGITLKLNAPTDLVDKIRGAEIQKCTINSIFSSFEITPDQEGSGTISLKLSPSPYLKSGQKLYLAHKVGENWVMHASQKVGDDEYRFSVDSFSPFVLVAATYNGGGGGGGGGGGTTVIPVTPIPTATVMPTMTPFDNPTAFPTSSSVPSTDATTQKSPVPIVGILAGMGAVALGRIVLRRK